MLKCVFKKMNEMNTVSNKRGKGVGFVSQLVGNVKDLNQRLFLVCLL